jgi:hypothetical protein
MLETTTAATIEAQILPRLQRAYAVQMSTVGAAWTLPNVELSLARSEAPFEVYAAILRGSSPTAESTVADDAAVTIGRVYGLADDLSDLTKDLERGHINSIACAAELGQGCPLRGGVSRLLESEAVGATATRLAEQMEGLAKLLQAGSHGQQDAVGLLLLVLGGIRLWTS